MSDVVWHSYWQMWSYIHGLYMPQHVWLYERRVNETQTDLVWIELLSKGVDCLNKANQIKVGLLSSRSPCPIYTRPMDNPQQERSGRAVYWFHNYTEEMWTVQISMMELSYVCLHYVWQSDVTFCKVAYCVFAFLLCSWTSGVYVMYEIPHNIWAQEYSGKCDIQMCAIYLLLIYII